MLEQIEISGMQERGTKEQPLTRSYCAGIKGWDKRPALFRRWQSKSYKVLVVIFHPTPAQDNQHL